MVHMVHIFITGLILSAVIQCLCEQISLKDEFGISNNLTCINKRQISSKNETELVKPTEIPPGFLYRITVLKKI